MYNFSIFLRTQNQYLYYHRIPPRAPEGYGIETGGGPEAFHGGSFDGGYQQNRYGQAGGYGQSGGNGRHSGGNYDDYKPLSRNPEFRGPPGHRDSRSRSSYDNGPHRVRNSFLHLFTFYTF